MISWRSTFRALAARETNIGPDFQNLAVLHVDRAGFDAARFRDVARARAMDPGSAGISSLAVVCRNGRCLAKCPGARLFIRFGAKDHVATRELVGVEPPVLGLCHFDAEIIVVGIRGADEQRPLARKLVEQDAWFRSAQGKSDWTGSRLALFAIPISSPSRGGGKRWGCSSMSILLPSPLRALTCPVVFLKRPSLARIRQDNATFFASAALLQELWISGFGCWIGILPKNYALSNMQPNLRQRDFLRHLLVSLFAAESQSCHSERERGIFLRVRWRITI